MVKKAKKHADIKKSVKNKKRKSVGVNTKRKVTARESTKFAALSPRFFAKIKQEYHDFDYIKDLDEKSKQYLTSFVEETLNARFNHSGKKLIKSKAKKREIYTENNARQRDAYGQNKAMGRNVDADPEVIIELLQQGLYVDDHEERLLQKEEQEDELLTVSEYLNLQKSGAYIPIEILAFYDHLFKNDTKFLKSENQSKKNTKKRSNG